MLKKDKSRLLKKKEEEEDWRNEHGQPSLKFLQSLVAEGSPRSLEKLKAIVEDLDVEYSPNTTPEELIDRILSDERGEVTITT